MALSCTLTFVGLWGFSLNLLFWPISWQLVNTEDKLAHYPMLWVFIKHTFTYRKISREVSSGNEEWKKQLKWRFSRISESKTMKYELPPPPIFCKFPRPQIGLDTFVPVAHLVSNTLISLTCWPKKDLDPKE